MSVPNKPQTRILAALAKSRLPLSRDKLVKAASITTAAWVVEYLGHAGMEVPFVIKEGKPSTIKKLVPAGYVKAVKVGGSGEEVNETLYEITDRGRAILKKIEAEAPTKQPKKAKEGAANKPRPKSKVA